MIRSRVTMVWAKLLFVILFAVATSAASFAQADVEIEIAGPWSYVPDPADTSRIVIVAADATHTMALFMGDNAFLYVGAVQLTKPALGFHRLDFPTVPCGSTPTPAPSTLYPAKGVSQQNIKSVLASSSVYLLSLPKPCSYVSTLESRMKYSDTRPVTGSDPEANFTTWMTLHYKVRSTTTAAVLDTGAPKPANLTFGSNSGSSKKAISVVVYLDVAPDIDCDSHSAAAFDATLKLWNLPSVYRAFPQLADLISSNEQLATYCYTCAQTPAGPTTHCATPGTGGKKKPRAPGRADCHAAQVNVNDAVN